MKIYVEKLRLCGPFKLGGGGDATAERVVAAFSVSDSLQLKRKASRSRTVPSCDISNITPTREVTEQSD
jgi:hypothetical protein